MKKIITRTSITSEHGSCSCIRTFCGLRTEKAIYRLGGSPFAFYPLWAALYISFFGGRGIVTESKKGLHCIITNGLLRSLSKRLIYQETSLFSSLSRDSWRLWKKMILCGSTTKLHNPISSLWQRATESGLDTWIEQSSYARPRYWPIDPSQCDPLCLLVKAIFILSVILWCSRIFPCFSPSHSFFPLTGKLARSVLFFSLDDPISPSFSLSLAHSLCISTLNKPWHNGRGGRRDNGGNHLFEGIFIFQRVKPLSDSFSYFYIHRLRL